MPFEEVFSGLIGFGFMTYDVLDFSRGIGAVSKRGR